MNIIDSFEAWYTQEFDWYISRKRRGYSLVKLEDGGYQWEHPRLCLLVWKAAHQSIKERNNEN